MKIFQGMPQYFTTFLTKRWAVSSVEQVAEAGMNIAYVENLSTTIKMLQYSPKPGKLVLVNALLTCILKYQSLRREKSP